MKRFIATLWIVLIATWVVSGEQLIDLVFAMPNAGPIDDWAISAVVFVEDTRAAAAPPDLFQALRDWLHSVTGLS